MSKLIVNADDFGYTSGINRSIRELADRGALASATAMCCGDALSEAVALARYSPAVGCHVVLLDGRPSAPLAKIRSLLGQDGGAFRPTLGSFLIDLTRGRIHDREIETEAVAQIRTLQALGVRLTHLDTHKHTHMFGRVLRPLLVAALQCGIRAIRNPFEPAWARGATPGAPLTRRLQVRALATLRQGFVRAVRHSGLQTTAGSLGVLATGSLDASTVNRLLEALARHGNPEATYELVCHPGYHDDALRAQRTRLQSERERERQALLEVIPQWTGPSGPHQLVTFADLYK